jgi:uncharacterized membrane protein
VGVGRAWWQFGRDRRYTTIKYLTDNTTEETKPLFGRHPVVVEYTPPMGLRPAQMGVIQDERADTTDVTATIIDLAVRGYIRIEELPKKRWFGSKDWKLHRLDKPTKELLPYESLLLSSLFQGSAKQVQISKLKAKFAERLNRVQDRMYDDAMERNWFGAKPRTVQTIWIGVGAAVIVVGAGATYLSGMYLGRILIGIPIILAGVALMLFSRHMSRRTAEGSEVRRRVEGFKLFIDTAEKHKQEFNERENIFAEYLPYAIVFGCVDKWAKAFQGIEKLEANARNSVGAWYVGASMFNARAFGRDMRGFSSNVGSTISSKPSSSGGSGFGGGGGAGRGGGGGGGGRW